METENNSTYATAPIGLIPNEKPFTESDIAAAKLREMMKYAEGERKCDLCKAARELEKKGQSQNFGWQMWPLLLMTFLFAGWGGNGESSDAFNKAFLETLEKMNKEKEAGDAALKSE